MIPVYKPYLTSESAAYANEALESTWISSKGKFIEKVEQKIADHHWTDDVRLRRALTCTNGTAATHLLAKLIQIKFPKINKIIVPNNVYVAAINSFLFDKHFELFAVDASVDTWNYDLDKLSDVISKSDLETTALLVTHNIGNIINVPKIQSEWPDILVVEDNCEGFGGFYEGVPSGTACFASSISFFANKNVTSGEGGAVICNEEDRGILYQLRSQGQSHHRFIHDVIGYNYRMTNIQAAILLGQLENYEKIKSKKAKVFEKYKRLLSDVSEVSFQSTEPNTQHSNWMFGVKINSDKMNYSDAEMYFNENFIEVRPMFYPLNRHGHLKEIPCDSYEAAELLNSKCLILPSYPSLEDHEICHIVNTLKQYLTSCS